MLEYKIVNIRYIYFRFLNYSKFASSKECLGKKLKYPCFVLVSILTAFVRKSHELHIEQGYMSKTTQRGHIFSQPWSSN